MSHDRLKQAVFPSSLRCPQGLPPSGFYGAVVWLLSFLLALTPKVNAQMVANSAKECAICHFRWLDQFYYEGRGTDLVEYQKERDAADEMMCYSCHNGILVDSRERFWAKRGHRVNIVPSEKVTVPPEMPLGEKKQIVCGTCHTAHGVADELRFQQSIYLRFPNRNSEICLKCHIGKDGGPRAGNHPIGVNSLPIPVRILDNYGRSGVEKDTVICESCHTVHGSIDKNLLVIPNKTDGEWNAQLCESCHTPNPSMKGKGIGMGTHPVDVVPKANLPQKWSEGTKLITGAKDEILCLTCHSPHGAQKETSILVKGGKSPLCIECHQQENLVVKTEHDLTLSAPTELDFSTKVGSQTGICGACHQPHNAEKYRLWSRPLSGLNGDAGSKMCESCHNENSCGKKKLTGTYSHPVNRDIAKVKGKVEFPTYTVLGVPCAQGTQGKILCTTCHNPHQWDPGKKEQGPGQMVEGGQSNSFLRMANTENSDFCVTCHEDQKTVLKTDHDLRITAAEDLNALEQKCVESGPCSACHAVHQAQGNRLWARVLPKVQDPVTAYCESCHREKACGEKKLVGTYTHPAGVDIRLAEDKTTLPLFDKMGVASELGKLVTCATCHNVHQWRPDLKRMGIGKNLEGDGNDSFLRIVNDINSTLCLDCHRKQQYIARTDHDLRFIAPREKNYPGDLPSKSGLCGTCHLAHNGTSILMFAKSVDGLQGDLANRLCTSCHKEKCCGEKKVISTHTHPMDKGIKLADGQIRLPLYAPDGTKQPEGRVACASCHNLHQWAPGELVQGTGENIEGTAKDSFLRLSMLPRPELCEECHQKECRVVGTDHDMGLVADTEKNIQKQTVSEAGVCSACHLIHNAPSGDMWAREFPSHAGSLSLTTRECASCHSQGRVGEKKVIANFSHPTDLVLAEKGIATTLPLYTLSGKVENSAKGFLTCNTCHNPHQWAPDERLQKSEPAVKERPFGKGKTVVVRNQEGDIHSSFLRLDEKEKENLCTDCHKDKKHVIKSEHDLSLFANKEVNIQGYTVEQSGICSACHLVHNSIYKTLLWAKQLPPENDLALATCLSCHEKGKCAESKSVFIGLHPSSFVYTGKISQFRTMGNTDYKTYFPLYDKQAKKSAVGFVTCITCHNAHQWDPEFPEYPAIGKNIEGDPRNSFLRNSGADFSICLDCHGFDAILRYKNYHVPSEWHQKYWKPGQDMKPAGAGGGTEMMPATTEKKPVP
ncbi:MAG: cytochrome c3 family protein [bacterium]